MTIYRCPQSKIIPGDQIFDLHQTHGVPLEISAVLACERKLVIDWNTFLTLAVQNGWSKLKTIKRCYQACQDAGYNDDVMKEIGGKL